jgi:hypothetical protein
MKEIERLTETN